MPFFPSIPVPYTTQQVTEVFRGYNHNLKIEDGEFFDMENLTSSYFPLLANRGKRGNVGELTAPKGLLAKSKLAYIDGTRLYYDGVDLTAYLLGEGYTISADDSMMPKQLVSMGAYIIIFPDALYINTENYTDCGSIEAKYSTTEGVAITYTLCKADGSAYDDVTISAIAPENPENGDLWIDTSNPVHALKQYSSNGEKWIDVLTVYTKIAHPGIGKNFSSNDGVTITGCDKADDEQIIALNGSKIIQDCGDDYIVVIGLIDQTYTQETGVVTVSREIPDMDFVIEAENRLWGCKYGLVNGETVNEIYCCALGDFKNWNQHLGIATDSYTASVGTDGQWTGAVTHLGHPIFFKEDCLHKVYISATGAHQIVDTACRGVQKGSHNSLVVVNETLFYKGVTDICAYDGSLPVSASPQLGTERYFEAAAGSLGDKYYVSMRDRNDDWHLFVYDTAKGFWHREDATHATCFARCNGELYYIDADTDSLMCVEGSVGEPEDTVQWSATTGIMGYNTVEQKYVSRFNLRMKLPVGSFADMYIQYDSDGFWHHAGHMAGTGTKTFMLPVRPRRCDHFQFKIEGEGDVRIYSFSKILEAGSDG